MPRSKNHISIGVGTFTSTDYDYKPIGGNMAVSEFFFMRPTRVKACQFNGHESYIHITTHHQDERESGAIYYVPANVNHKLRRPDELDPETGDVLDGVPEYLVFTVEGDYGYLWGTGLDTVRCDLSDWAVWFDDSSVARVTNKDFENSCHSVAKVIHHTTET